MTLVLGKMFRNYANHYVTEQFIPFMIAKFVMVKIDEEKNFTNNSYALFQFIEILEAKNKLNALKTYTGIICL